MKKYLAGVIMLSIILSSFPLAALAQTMPQTLDESKTLSSNILALLPGSIRNVWDNQVLPVWRGMWTLFKGFWDSTLGGWVETLWHKLWKLQGKETPDVKNEFQKSKQVMQNDFWARFKDLLK